MDTHCAFDGCCRRVAPLGCPVITASRCGPRLAGRSCFAGSPSSLAMPPCRRSLVVRTPTLGTAGRGLWLIDTIRRPLASPPNGLTKDLTRPGRSHFCMVERKSRGYETGAVNHRWPFTASGWLIQRGDAPKRTTWFCLR